jgi:hypothetical protein
MNFNFKFRNSILTLLVSIVVLSVPVSVFAVNCEKKPDHPDCTDPPPDGGGNDTADPDWQILAVNSGGAPTFATYDCVAFNPDLKGPGIAYLGFYDHFGYETCAETTTSVDQGEGTVIDIRRIEVQTDGDGKFTTIQLSGRNPQDGILYESRAVSFADSDQPGPTSEVYFTLEVRTSFVMYGCGTSKKKGNTVCDQDVGTISLYDLEYCPLGSPCPKPAE